MSTYDRRRIAVGVALVAQPEPAGRALSRARRHPSPVPRSRRRAGLYYCRITADCGTWGVRMSWRICTCPQGCPCGTHVHTLRPLCRALTRVAPCGGDQNDPRMVCESVVVRNGDSLRLLSARHCCLSVFHARSLFLFLTLSQFPSQRSSHDISSTPTAQRLSSSGSTRVSTGRYLRGAKISKN